LEYTLRTLINEIAWVQTANSAAIMQKDFSWRGKKKTTNNTNRKKTPHEKNNFTVLCSQVPESKQGI